MGPLVLRHVKRILKVCSESRGSIFIDHMSKSQIKIILFYFISFL